MLQVKRDVVPPGPRGDDEVDEQLGTADENAVTDLELERLAAVGARRADPAVGVQRGRDSERIPGAVREPRASARLDPVRRLDGGERVQHPDLGRPGLEHERVGVVQAPVGVRDVTLVQSQLRRGRRRRACPSVRYEGGVEVVANTQVELVHPASIPSQGALMSLGLRTILLLRCGRSLRARSVRGGAVRRPAHARARRVRGRLPQRRARLRRPHLRDERQQPEHVALMTEVSAPGEDHRGAGTFDSFDHVEVALGAAWLDEGIDAGVEREPRAVREGEERVRGE